MKARYICLAVPALMVLARLGLCIEGETSATADKTAASGTPSICFRAIPAPLAIQVSDRLTELCKRCLVSEGQARQIRETVQGLDSRNVTPASNKANRVKLRQSGVATLPVLSVMLESQDDDNRLKAISAMKQLLFPALLKEATKSGDSHAASLQVALLRRSMCDKSTKVRRIALIALRGIALGQPGTDSEEAKAGIAEACTDPDMEIRSRAEDYRQRLSAAGLKQVPSP